MVRVRKIPGIENVSDLLTKHVAPKVFEKLSSGTGYRKCTAAELEIVPVKMERVNDITKLKDANPLVVQHESKMKSEARAQALVYRRMLAVEEESSQGACQSNSIPPARYEDHYRRTGLIIPIRTTT